MPWSHSAVFLPDTPAARAVLTADSRLRGHVYALDLAAVEQPPRIAAGSTGALLVVRSPARTADVARTDDGFDASFLDGPRPSRLAGARGALPGPAQRLAPADGPLRWFEALADATQGPVVWYLGEAIASDPDAEIAWVLDAGGPDHVDDEAIDRGPMVYVRRDRNVVALRADGPRWATRDTLGAGLLHLGVRLDGPWFTPHRPGFDWAALRLA